MRENSRLLVLDEYLLRWKSRQRHNAFVDIARDKVLITPVDLGISFFNQRDPDLIEVLASSKHWLSCLHINRDPFVNDNIEPRKINEDFDYVKTDRSILVEDWGVNSLGEDARDDVVDDHIFTVFHASSTAHQKLVSLGKHA